MFDETSSKWIELYKGYTKVMFWVYIAAAVTLCLCGWTDCIWITESPFLDGIILLASGALVAFAHLVLNMLLIQFLNNVQMIREILNKLSTSTIKQTNNIQPKAEEKEKREAEEIAQKKAQIFFCPKCSKAVNYGDVSCGSCGQQFDWSEM